MDHGARQMGLSDVLALYIYQSEAPKSGIIYVVCPIRIERAIRARQMGFNTRLGRVKWASTRD